MIKDLELIRKIHSELKIDPDYASKRNLKFYSLETDLVERKNDIDERVVRLEQNAALGWDNMKACALSEGIHLWMYSGFRDYDYQKVLIQRRLDKGVSLSEILEFQAAPGYSEHHTGRALDLTTIDSKPGHEEFENTPAFTWLKNNASEYSFFMTYPRDNSQGFLYEPWHWCFKK